MTDKRDEYDQLFERMVGKRPTVGDFQQYFHEHDAELEAEEHVQARLEVLALVVNFANGRDVEPADILRLANEWLDWINA